MQVKCLGLGGGQIGVTSVPDLNRPGLAAAVSLLPQSDSNKFNRKLWSLSGAVPWTIL